MGLPLRAARIDLTAIAHNLQVIQEKVAPARILVDLSADAYGHGAAQVARAAEDADIRSFVVATVAEAVALRRSGTDAAILAWLHPAAETFRAAADYRVSVAVSSRVQLAAARAAGVPAVQLAVAVGGNALGCPTAHWGALVEEAARHRGADAPDISGIMGLPPRRTPSSRTDLESLRHDQRDFARSIAAARAGGLDPDLAHLAGSAEAIAGIVEPDQAVRIGRALYGLSPFTGETAAELGLLGAMTVTARVIGTKTIPAG